MGCELGKLASSGTKKGVDTNLNDPPAPAATDDRLPLTARQKWTMVASWKAISRAMEPTGVNMFVKWVKHLRLSSQKVRAENKQKTTSQMTTSSRPSLISARGSERHQMYVSKIWVSFKTFFNASSTKNSVSPTFFLLMCSSSVLYRAIVRGIEKFICFNFKHWLERCFAPAIDLKWINTINTKHLFYAVIEKQ